MKVRSLWFGASLVFALAIACAPTRGYAFGDGTPDTDPPAEEGVCDGLEGRLWGLCVAYCEAQDCPGSAHPSCEVLRNKLSNMTGSGAFPCDGGGGIG